MLRSYLPRSIFPAILTRVAEVSDSTCLVGTVVEPNARPAAEGDRRHGRADKRSTTILVDLEKPKPAGRSEF